MTQEATELLVPPAMRPTPQQAAPPEIDPAELLSRASFAWRCQHSRELGDPRSGVRIDGDYFDAKRVPYLLELYDEIHPHLVIMKGAQLGVTAWAVLTVIERMRNGTYPRGAIYGFPTQDEVYDFAQARFDKMLRDNPRFFAGAVRSTDRTELKEIGTGHLYFRGIRQPDKTKRPSKLLSIPSDVIILDEHDDMDPSAIAIVLSRLDSSLLMDESTGAQGHLIELGHPTFPEYGIALKYEASDKRAWMIHCESCGEYTCLEHEFPACLGRSKGGSWFRCCRNPKCRREIFVLNGEWVAEHPTRDVRGYLMSQLLSATKPMDKIVAEYEAVSADGRDEAKFWNLVLARPYAKLDDSLTTEYAESLFDGDRPELKAHPGECFLGADVGVRTIHVDIGHHPAERRDHIHCSLEVATFDELLDLGKRHHVQCGVIDVMAETRSVSDFIKRAPWAWGCRYDEAIHTDYQWNPKERIVKVGRTASLDASHRAMIDRRITFRRLDRYAQDVIIPQLTNLVRIQVESASTIKTGQMKYAWHVRGVKNDHHRHALNYAHVAGERVRVAPTEAERRRRERTPRPRNWQAA